MIKELHEIEARTKPKSGKLKKRIIKKYKWAFFACFFFLFFMVLIPIFFLTLFSTYDSTPEEILVYKIAPQRSIEDSLKCEERYGGRWIDIMVFHYVLFEFDWDKVKFSKMSKVIEDRIISGVETYEDILGKKDYEGYKELRDYYYKIYDDIADVETIDEDKEIVYEMYYPIPKGYQFTHYDDFGADRSYGGERNHMGNDIMAHMGTPIVAVAPGIIEKIGWNELGGWRIGIRDNKNRYWYYAHMKEYAENMRQGKRVYSGEVIGYVGNTGYGPEGTKGKFDYHLHIQIGVEFQEGELTWINPYELLMTLRYNNRITLEEDEEDDGN